MVSQCVPRLTAIQPTHETARRPRHVQITQRSAMVRALPTLQQHNRRSKGNELRRRNVHDQRIGEIDLLPGEPTCTRVQVESQPTAHGIAEASHLCTAPYRFKRLYCRSDPTAGNPARLFHTSAAWCYKGSRQSATHSFVPTNNLYCTVNK